MRKHNITEWAAIAEIVGTIAVVISLLFLIRSINQNTEVMQVSNDNFVYELQHARVRDFMSSPGMAEIYVKLNKGEELSETEAMRIFWDNMLDLSGWEITFTRYEDGHYSKDQWDNWDRYYRTAFVPRFPRENWDDVKEWFNPHFRVYVDAVYAKLQVN